MVNEGEGDVGPFNGKRAKVEGDTVCPVMSKNKKEGKIRERLKKEA
jgi:hypothetical protein